MESLSRLLRSIWYGDDVGSITEEHHLHNPDVVIAVSTYK